VICTVFFCCSAARCVLCGCLQTDEEDVEGAESREHKRWIERYVSCGCCSGWSRSCSPALWIEHTVSRPIVTYHVCDMLSAGNAALLLTTCRLVLCVML
jgi:hypothetical protein